MAVLQLLFSSVQFSSVAESCPTLCNPMNHSMPGLPVHHQLPESTSTHVHCVRDAIQPSLLLLPSIFPSIRVLSNESALWIRWPKNWSFSFNISLSVNTQDWSPLRWTGWTFLQSKGLLSLFQHHSSKASILRCSAFFIVQLSHPYMTTGKTIALTWRTFVHKVMSLLCKMLSRMVITFLPRSKRLLISWLQSLSAVILEPRKITSATMCHEVMGIVFSILFKFLSCEIYVVIVILSSLCIIISIFLLLVITLLIRIRFHTLFSNKKAFPYPTHPTNTESFLFLQSNRFF